SRARWQSIIAVAPRIASCSLDLDTSRRLPACCPMKLLTALIVSGFACITPFAVAQTAGTAPAVRTTGAAPDLSRYFPPPVQSFPLYGEGEIPNSKPTPDEETDADSGFLRNVSRPRIDVHLPA